ncbi:aminotransferase class I/II-fold pyridoxal phosphate-dependent enzyme [Pseudomaricurvus sp. HS19]|uniref:aminotransferase class I/II-fold pyridoxal phosphate-dependent enzyme n=1 Tax=Pseudomaricurvus sp. HS19 TaxID=2692626 RepID=UPI00136C6AA4|nr:aminotransferase class I/II-fold pyridoxal phosphate-dependent enzyme [Pseudomaricurvus sp. HS19]MYM63160.1 aminotransferase class I/II-fold pyridoxal phosphate-dependent enzyme [Pseudomaricurvus sp. HS19]
MLNHGGKLAEAQQRYPQQREWLDLSTGIAPWSWPVPEIPAAVWQRLPESDAALRTAAAGFYGCDAERLLPVAGSQVAIETLPGCVPGATVAVPLWGYGEHRHCWQKQGHSLVFYRNFPELLQLLRTGAALHAVAINPNNPAGSHWSCRQLQLCLEALAPDGLLVVDEAFADLQHPSPALQMEHDPRLVVLRSVGKFFGMAGLRLGFVIATAPLRDALQARLPHWGVSHPALWLGERMLADSEWQRQQRQRIDPALQWLEDIVRQLLPASWQGGLQSGPLFVSLFGDPCSLQEFAEACMADGVLLRYFAPQENRSCVRIGLCDEAHRARLQSVLEKHVALLQVAAKNNCCR